MKSGLRRSCQGCVCLLLIGYWLGGLVPSAFAGDARALIPKETLSFMSFNLTQFWPTLPGRALKRFCTNQSELKRGFLNFVTDFGIDPRSFKQFVMCVTIAFDPKTKKHEMIFIIDGAFDIPLILEQVGKKPHDFTKTTFQGFPAFKLNNIPNESRLGSLVVFPDATTLLFGEDAALSEILAIRAGKGENIDANEPLMRLVKQMNTDSLLWGGGFLSKNYKERFRAAGNHQVAAVDEFFYSFDCREDLAYHLTAHLEKNPGKDAGPVDETEGLITVLRGWRDSVTTIFTNLGTLEAKTVGSVLERITIEGKDGTAKVNLTVPKSTLEALHRKLEDAGIAGRKNQ